MIFLVGGGGSLNLIENNFTNIIFRNFPIYVPTIPSTSAHFLQFPGFPCVFAPTVPVFTTRVCAVCRHYSIVTSSFPKGYWLRW
jgi:hypothetical protein